MPSANDGGSSWNATLCTPIDPNPDSVGEPCKAEESALSGVDSCDAGAMCWSVDHRTLEGYCIQLCMGSSEDPQCPAGTVCRIQSDGVLLPCLPLCDPLAQDCPEGEVCIPYYDGQFLCYFDGSGEGGDYGDPCEYANSCSAGLYCINPEYVPDCPAAGCCSPFCDTSKPNLCPGEGLECIPWYEPGSAPDGYANVGYCGIPQ